MHEDIKNRFVELIQRGEALVNSLPYDSSYGGIGYWTRDSELCKLQAWIQSSSNLINLVVPEHNPIRDNIKIVLSDSNYVSGSSVPCHTVQKVFGLLKAVYEEMQHGLLKNFEYIVFAEAFDDFLDHAVKLHKGGQKNEASILAAIVFEDTIKKIAKKNGIAPSGKTLDPLIDELIKNNVFNAVKGKRIKGQCGLRNHALHAEWEEFDIKDVGEFIKSTQSVIEDFLA